MWQSPRDWYQKMHDFKGASNKYTFIRVFFFFFQPTIFEISNPMILFRQASSICTSVHDCLRFGHDNFTLEIKFQFGLYWICIELKTLSFWFFRRKNMLSWMLKHALCDYLIYSAFTWKQLVDLKRKLDSI